MSCTTIKGCVFEDSSFNMLARIESGGLDVTRSTVSSITWKVFNVLDEEASIANGALVVDDVIFDTLQLDKRWARRDNAGYNFLHVLPATTLAAPGTYRIEHKVTMLDGTSFYLHPFEPTVQAIWSS
jgi:hypothetical protein